MSLEGRPEEAQSIRTIHAALDAGVNLIDTADAYAIDDTDIGHNERLIAKALRGRRDGVLVATKGGHRATATATGRSTARPSTSAACEASLTALETDRIDLYQYHRPDPTVPYAESIGALKELQDEGKVRWIGISNADTRPDRGGRSIVELVSVQNQLSLEYTSPHRPRARSRSASSTGSRSCPGRRSAASPTRPTPRAATTRSRTPRTPTASRPSRSRWPGCSPSAR